MSRFRALCSLVAWAFVSQDGAVGPWKLYNDAKRIIGTGGLAMTAGGITLGVGVFKMSLHRTAASANVNNFAISTFASIGNEISARGGYAAGGRNLLPAAGQWTVGASAKQMKFTYSSLGLVFTASGSSLVDVRYAVIRTSSGAGAGKLVCYCSLSSAQFTVASPNTLTVLPNASGVFTFA